VANIVVAQEPALESVEYAAAILARTPQIGDQIGAALDRERGSLTNCPQNLGFAIREGRILLLERLVLLVETASFEPLEERALGHPDHHAVDGVLVAALHGVEESPFGGVVLRIHGVDFTPDVLLQILGRNPPRDQLAQPAIDQFAHQQDRHPGPPLLDELP
jgi:hypothetical protein